MTITMVSIARQLEADAVRRLPTPRRGMVRSALAQSAWILVTCAGVGAFIAASAAFQ